MIFSRWYFCKKKDKKKFSLSKERRAVTVYQGNHCPSSMKSPEQLSQSDWVPWLENRELLANTMAMAEEKVKKQNNIETMTLHMHYTSWYISLPFCAQLQCEMTKLKILSRTWTHDGAFLFSPWTVRRPYKSSSPIVWLHQTDWIGIIAKKFKRLGSHFFKWRFSWCCRRGCLSSLR